MANIKDASCGPSCSETTKSGLKRSHALLVIGEDANSVSRLRGDKPLFQGRIVVPDQVQDDLQNQRVVAFAGIGLPEKFRKTIQDIGADLVGFHAFPDHHSFSQLELDRLAEEARSLEAQLVTTEKDWVRLPERVREVVRAVPIALEFEDPTAVKAWLKRALVRQ